MQAEAVKDLAFLDLIFTSAPRLINSIGEGLKVGRIDGDPRVYNKTILEQ